MAFLGFLGMVALTAVVVVWGTREIKIAFFGACVLFAILAHCEDARDCKSGDEQASPDDRRQK
jgi:hypothetical protein